MIYSLHSTGQVCLSLYNFFFHSFFYVVDWLYCFSEFVPIWILNEPTRQTNERANINKFLLINLLLWICFPQHWPLFHWTKAQTNKNYFIAEIQCEHSVNLSFCIVKMSFLAMHCQLSHELCLSDRFGAIKRKFVCKTANKHKSKTMLKSSQNRFISKAIIFRCVIIYGRNFFFAFLFPLCPLMIVFAPKFMNIYEQRLTFFHWYAINIKVFPSFSLPHPFFCRLWLSFAEMLSVHGKFYGQSKAKKKEAKKLSSCITFII